MEKQKGTSLIMLNWGGRISNVPFSFFQIDRMDAFWGDNTWRESLYKKSQSLFEELELEDKASNTEVAAAYRKRLREVAGFAYVPEPIPMRNSKGAIIYYLFFASANKTGAKIVGEIFEKYRNRGRPDGR